MHVLAIHTATAVCGVALTSDDRVAGEIQLYGPKQHSEHLLRLIDGLCTQTGIPLTSIDIIAVTAGPGSFTGLRVGISTAQGLAMALKRPLVGVSTLEALAAQAYSPGRHVCPMIDARKQQVYTCLYRYAETGTLQIVVPETVTAPERWIAELPMATLFIGDAACVHRDYIEKMMQKGLVAPDFLAIPRAATVALLARNRYLHTAPEECATIAPCYVRLPDAELNPQVRKRSFNPVVP